MSAPSLTAKYRPQRFGDVAGQEAIKRILSKASAMDKIAPAYLFSGTRGVGKTTLARVLAKALNCVNAPTDEPCNECHQCRQITAGVSPDVVEIDAATHGGVEEARRLKEDIGYAPLQSRYKVFIIDEAHMLSKAAFNALLKTLEEPPGRVTFILATTEPHKILPTIISRCQHYIFKRLALPELEAHLAGLLNREGLSFEPKAVSLIARRGAGSVRDSMSLLAQVLALGGTGLTEQDVRDVLGLAGQDVFLALMQAFLDQDCLAVAQVLRQVLDRGLDIGFFLRELATCWRNMFILNQAGEKALESMEISAEEGVWWLKWSARFDARHIHACWQMTLDGQRRVMTSLEPALALELLLLNLAYLPRLIALEPQGQPQAAQGGQAGGQRPAAPQYPRPASAAGAQGGYSPQGGRGGQGGYGPQGGFVSQGGQNSYAPSGGQGGYGPQGGAAAPGARPSPAPAPAPAPGAASLQAGGAPARPASSSQGQPAPRPAQAPYQPPKPARPQPAAGYTAQARPTPQGPQDAPPWQDDPSPPPSFDDQPPPYADEAMHYQDAYEAPADHGPPADYAPAPRPGGQGAQPPAPRQTGPGAYAAAQGQAGQEVYAPASGRDEPDASPPALRQAGPDASPPAPGQAGRGAYASASGQAGPGAYAQPPRQGVSGGESPQPRRPEPAPAPVAAPAGPKPSGPRDWKGFHHYLRDWAKHSGKTIIGLPMLKATVKDGPQGARLEIIPHGPTHHRQLTEKPEILAILRECAKLYFGPETVVELAALEERPQVTPDMLKDKLSQEPLFKQAVEEFGGQVLYVKPK